jgi:hypothetical protein
MAYRDEVEYIAKMRPDVVRSVGGEHLRTRGVLRAALPALSGLPGTVEWRSDASGLYEQRLREAIGLVEGLHDGFDRAGAAIADYAEAQTRAKAMVADGAAAEEQLGSLISAAATAQPSDFGGTDALRQWPAVRGAVADPAWPVGTFGRGGFDEQDRVQGDALWARATAAYDDAIRIESEARTDAVTRLAAARTLVPELQAGAPLSEKVVAETLGPEDVGGGGDPDQDGDADGYGDGRYRLGPPTLPTLEYDDDFPYDPAAVPTATDHASWNMWDLTLAGAQVLRPDLDDATALYAHYRDGTGTDATVDYE